LIKPTKHQEIWERKEDDSLVLVLPKIINSDIGFQLMFGFRESQRDYKDKQTINNNNYKPKTYIDVKHYKKHI
jgi:hypothetical protein|tara:strand:- start:275 stop:493 length:219 start_codon:yes stop_codon:yes gene_type:complete